MEGFSQNTAKKDVELKENRLEKPKVKEGVEFVFEEYPLLARIGNMEEYSEYLDTIFPDSKIKDILYHQTSSKEFDAKDWKLSGLGGAYFSFYNSELTDPEWKKALVRYMFDLGRKNRTIIAIANARNPFVINRRNVKEIHKKTGLNTQDVTKLRKNFDLSENDSIIGYPGGSRWDKGELDDIENHTIPLDKTSPVELALFDPSNQVHILGIQSDLEKFKEFISSQKVNK